MPSVDIVVPSIGQEVLISLKEPFHTYVKNKHNLDSLTKKMTVVSVISMEDTIRNDLRDPFSDLYLNAGVGEVEYKKDLLNKIPIISFSFRDSLNVERFFRVPINYIAAIENTYNVEYINKLIVIDLNKLPTDVDTTAIFPELTDFIEERIGIKPDMKEVALGDIELIDDIEHGLRETVRKNMVTVNKTMAIQFQELQLKHNQLLERLSQLNIVLG